MRKLTFASFLIGATLAVSSVALAEQNVPIHISGGGAADLLNMTTTPPELGGAPGGNEEGVRHFCTNKYGKIVQENDAQYADCLRKHDESNSPKIKPVSDEKTGAKALGSPSAFEIPSSSR